MILAFAPKHNSHGRRDASHAFIPEAKAFCMLHGAAPPILFDNEQAFLARCAFVRGRIEACEPGALETLALFCHGWKDGLQVGVRIGSVRPFVDSLSKVAAPQLRIILYCCDTARDADDDRVDDTKPGPGGDGGFADKLRDECRIAGVSATVYAHTTAGHTTRNPRVRRFDPDEMAGGHWVIEPYGPMWGRWRKALRGDLRFRFPFLSELAIAAELLRGES